MKILAIEQEIPGFTKEDFEPFLLEEAAKVWELYQAGICRELYFRQDRPEAVLMLECADVEEAHDILNSLPLVKNGLVKFKVIPLRAYSGFARLFAEHI